MKKAFSKIEKRLTIIRVNKYGALAQLGARYIRIVEAVGSNPICSIRVEAWKC